ncbi:MAG: NAD(P)/FAD-dependent oxidoreductase, partial [Eggerthellaceae bacterium]
MLFDVDEIKRLAHVMKSFKLTVGTIADTRAAQVRRGGVDPSLVDACTLEVIDTPGLYLVGEALDVDAPCGGYNLHWAWTCGLVT